jgi:hypothetical protein
MQAVLDEIGAGRGSAEMHNRMSSEIMQASGGMMAAA